MIEKLEKVASRYAELTELLGTPDVIGNRELFSKYSKEHSDLDPIVKCFHEWRQVKKEMEESKELSQDADDAELRKLAAQEFDTLREREEKLYGDLIFLLLPTDPNDEKNIILEIRAGTGGDEAALFAADLFNAYVRYAESKRWRIEILSSSASSVGGFKEVIAKIEGKGAYSVLKYESGVHRVQRVPKTETQGRIHTSTITVAVLPEAEEIDIAIADSDLRIDVFRASGPGGQSVNTTDSAVRVTHIPTGLVVTCQDEKSQLKNKQKALTVLRARLFDRKQAEQDAERRDSRRAQIGTGERSERIRTYNFPQGRVTDHRVGVTLYQIDALMYGDLDLIIQPLIAHYRSEALKGVKE